MVGGVRRLTALTALAVALAACGGANNGVGGGGGGAATAPAKETLPPDLKVTSCVPTGPYIAGKCSDPIETIFAQVSSKGPFDEVRVTVVGTMDCANPREFPAATPNPKAYYWMVRFAKGGTDSGGFVGAGGKLGTICTPFTGT